MFTASESWCLTQVGDDEDKSEIFQHTEVYTNARGRDARELERWHPEVC